MAKRWQSVVLKRHRRGSGQRRWYNEDYISCVSSLSQNESDISQISAKYNYLQVFQLIGVKRLSRHSHRICLVGCNSLKVSSSEIYDNYIRIVSGEETWL